MGQRAERLFRSRGDKAGAVGKEDVQGWTKQTGKEQEGERGLQWESSRAERVGKPTSSWGPEKPLSGSRTNPCHVEGWWAHESRF